MTGAGVKERDLCTELCFSKRIRYVAHTLRVPRTTTNVPAGHTCRPTLTTSSTRPRFMINHDNSLSNPHLIGSC